MTLLALDDLSVALRGRDILAGVSVRVDAGEFVGLVGPNGAGKTTLMRAALGLVPARGHCSLLDHAPAERARRVAWMPQARDIAWPVSVEVLVALGRVPHLPTGRPLSPRDRAQVDAALAAMGLDDMRHRTATRLSGGEQARVLIARALAQDTPLLMADEPIAGLDPAHQISTMQVFAGLAREGRAVIASLHDLGLAARHCTRLLLLGEGGLVADGPPGDVLTPDNLARVFHVNAWFGRNAAWPSVPAAGGDRMTARLTLDRPWLSLDMGAPMRVLSWAVNRPGMVTARHILWREVRNADLPADLDVGAWLCASEMAGRDGLCLLTSRDMRAFHRGPPAPRSRRVTAHVQSPPSACRMPRPWARGPTALAATGTSLCPVTAPSISQSNCRRARGGLVRYRLAGSAKHRNPSPHRRAYRRRACRAGRRDCHGHRYRLHRHRRPTGRRGLRGAAYRAGRSDRPRRVTTRLRAVRQNGMADVSPRPQSEG